MTVQWDNCASLPATSESWLSQPIASITAANFAPARSFPSKPWHRVPFVVENHRLGLRTIWKRVAGIPCLQDNAYYSVGLLELAADGKGQRKRCRGSRHVPTLLDAQWQTGHDRLADGVKRQIQEAKDAIARFETLAEPSCTPSPTLKTVSQASFPENILRFVPRKRNGTRIPLLPVARVTSPKLGEGRISQAPELQPSPEVHITERSRRRVRRRVSDLPTLCNSVSDQKSSPTERLAARRATISALVPPFFSPLKQATSLTTLQGESPAPPSLQGFTIRATPLEVAVENPVIAIEEPESGPCTPTSKQTGELATIDGTSPAAIPLPIVVFCQPSRDTEQEPVYETRRRISLHNRRSSSKWLRFIERRESPSSGPRRHSLASGSGSIMPERKQNLRGRRNTFQPIATMMRQSSVLAPEETKIELDTKLGFSHAVDVCTTADASISTVHIRATFPLSVPHQFRNDSEAVGTPSEVLLRAQSDAGRAENPPSDSRSLEDHTFQNGPTITDADTKQSGAEVEDAGVDAVIAMSEIFVSDIAIGEQHIKSADVDSMEFQTFSDESAQSLLASPTTMSDSHSEKMPGIFAADFNILAIGSVTPPSSDEIVAGSDKEDQHSSADFKNGSTPARVACVVTIPKSPLVIDSASPSRSLKVGQPQVDHPNAAILQFHPKGPDVFSTPTKPSNVLYPLDTPSPSTSTLSDSMQLHDNKCPGEMSINGLLEDDDATRTITVIADGMVGERQSVHDDSDTEMLRKFVTRVKADKSAKAAAAAAAATRGKTPLVHKRRSGSIGSAASSGSPVSKRDNPDMASSARRLPLSGKDSNASPSPTKNRKEHKDGLSKTSKDLLSKPALDDTTPPRPKRRRKKMESDTGGIFNPEFMPSQTDDGSETSGPRRSKRTRNQASLKPTTTSANSALSLIPVRLPGSLSMNGDDSYGLGTASLSLRRNVEKDLAAVTRVNTRKNKGNADPASVVLASWATNGQQKSTFNSSTSSVEEDSRSKTQSKTKKTGRQKKAVRWADVLVRTQETDNEAATRSANVGEDADQQFTSQAPNNTPVPCLVGGVASVVTQKSLLDTTIPTKVTSEASPPQTASSVAEPEKKAIPRRTTRASRLQPPTPIGKLPSGGTAGEALAVSSNTAPRMATRRTKILSMGMSGNGTPAPKRRASRMMS